MRYTKSLHTSHLQAERFLEISLGVIVTGLSSVFTYYTERPKIKAKVRIIFPLLFCL